MLYVFLLIEKHQSDPNGPERPNDQALGQENLYVEAWGGPCRSFGGPLPVINGVITPRNGLINGWLGVITPISGVITLVIPSRDPPCRDGVVFNSMDLLLDCARSGLTPATQRVDQRFRGVPLAYRGARFIFLEGKCGIDGTGGVTSIHMSHLLNLLALVQLLVFMCFIIWCFLQLLMNRLVVRVYHKRSFFELISFIELHWTSTWISPKVGKLAKPKEKHQKTQVIWENFHWENASNTMLMPLLMLLEGATQQFHLCTCVDSRDHHGVECQGGGSLLEKSQGFFVLISTQHTKRKTYNQDQVGSIF